MRTGGSRLTGCNVLGIGPHELLAKDAKHYQFYPTEEYAKVTIEADGSLLVTQDLLFDVGAEDVRWPLSGWSPHQITVARAPGTGTRWIVRPEISEVSAEVVAPATRALAVSTPKKEESGWRWQIGENWLPGRRPPVWRFNNREGAVPVDDPERPSLDGADGDLYLFTRPSGVTAAPGSPEVVR